MQVLIVIDISRDILTCISVTVPVRIFHFTPTTHFFASEVVPLTHTSHCAAGSLLPHLISCSTALGAGGSVVRTGCSLSPSCCQPFNVGLGRLGF